MDDFFTGYNLNISYDGEHNFVYLTSKVIKTFTFQKELEGLVKMNLDTDDVGYVKSMVVVK